jgi:hypothetical protein
MMIELLPDGDVKTTATVLDVSVLPLDFEDRFLWSITVEYRGRNLWAVKHGMHQCLGSDGTWDWESIPSERTDEWLATHRFPLDEALALARGMAAKITFRGITPQEAMERAKEKDDVR